MSRVRPSNAAHPDSTRNSSTRGPGGTAPRRLVRIGAIAATIAGVSLVAPQAMAATSHQGARAAAPPPAMYSHVASTASKKPFQIRAGRIYDIVASVHGVRTGQRLALEIYYWHRWHVKGSWKMHRGSYHFRGRARSTHPGLYTMRVQFLSRQHKPIKGTQSNTFKVRVLRFHVPKAHRPRTSPGNAVPNTKISDWNDIQCAEALPGLGHGLIVPSPVARLTGTGEVNQVVWVRDALPGGYFSNWYIAQTDEQYIHPADPGIITITGQGDIKDSSYLDDLYIEYPAVTEWHEVAWDLQIQGRDGNWYWASSSWYTPNSYIQWNQPGNAYSQSANCLTYQSAGHN
jgi:hypothetical protein